MAKQGDRRADRDRDRERREGSVTSDESETEDEEYLEPGEPPGVLLSEKVDLRSEVADRANRRLARDRAQKPARKQAPARVRIREDLNEYYGYDTEDEEEDEEAEEGPVAARGRKNTPAVPPRK